MLFPCVLLLDPFDLVCSFFRHLFMCSCHGISWKVISYKGYLQFASSMFLKLLCNLTVFYRFDEGAHFFWRSIIMKTHGAKQQFTILKRTPKEQLEPVFKVWVSLPLLRVYVAWAYWMLKAEVRIGKLWILCCIKRWVHVIPFVHSGIRYARKHQMENKQKGVKFGGQNLG